MPYVSDLEVPFGQGGQVVLAAPLHRRRGFQVGHELQVGPMIRAHLVGDG